MWPGQQPPGGEQNPQAQNNPYQQPGYQQANPYQQPGYQQPSAYGQQQPQWGAPTVAGGPQPQPGGGGGGNRTKVVAIVAATAVVVAAGVTGFLVLGGKDDDPAEASDKTSTSPTVSESASASASSGTDDNPRDDDTEPATITGWKVVVNPKWGIAFDVPADWEVQSPGLSQGFEWEDKEQTDGYDSIIMGGTVEYKSKWCGVDDDKDGKTDYTPLAMAGSKGAEGAKNTDEIAINTPAWWVFGGYTEPDKKSISFDEKATAYTTTSGIKGSYAWAQSTNTPQKGKCDSDGKAITFGFKNSKGDFVSWNWYGAKGVKEEVPKETIMKILSTVRLHGEPTEN